MNGPRSLQPSTIACLLMNKLEAMKAKLAGLRDELECIEDEAASIQSQIDELEEDIENALHEPTSAVKIELEKFVSDPNVVARVSGAIIDRAWKLLHGETLDRRNSYLDLYQQLKSFGYDYELVKQHTFK
jgi:predicted nuclease with TOPRIM domain